MPEPIGRRKLLQNSPALDFVDMAMSGDLAQALTQELDTIGVQVPGAMIISEDPVVTLQTVDPSNPTAGVSDPGADSYYFYEYEYTYDYGSEEYGGMIGGSDGDMGPMEPIPGEPGPGPERPGPGSEPEDPVPPVDEDYDGSMAFVTEPPPAIEILPYVPLVTLRMTFEGFTVQDLSLIPGAGNAFCSFFRRVKVLCFAVPEDLIAVQIPVYVMLLHWLALVFQGADQRHGSCRMVRHPDQGHQPRPDL